jgi:hypothetical protein
MPSVPKARLTAALRAFSLTTCITECNAVARFRLSARCGVIGLEVAGGQIINRGRLVLAAPIQV